MKKILLAALLCLSASCAMQRARDAETAQAWMRGMDKEHVFACMGIPARKASQGETEIWQYKSGNDRVERSYDEGKVSGAKAVGGSSLVDAMTLSLLGHDEVKEKRYCVVQVVFKAETVQNVNYTGPTGGFLTEDEQCAYAVRNCGGRD